MRGELAFVVFAIGGLIMLFIRGFSARRSLSRARPVKIASSLEKVYKKTFDDLEKEVVKLQSLDIAVRHQIGLVAGNPKYADMHKRSVDLQSILEKNLSKPIDLSNISAVRNHFLKSIHN